MELNDLIKSNCYHICTNGQEAPLLMKDDEDYKVACVYLALVAWKLNVDVFAYIVMSNHVHFLVACKNRKEAEVFLKAYKQKLALYFMHKYGIRKPLRGISDSITLVDSLHYFRNCVAYILRNALCAKVCKRLEDYPWSSYSAYFADSKKLNLRRLDSYTGREIRKLIRSNDDVAGCPICVCDDGRIADRSFVRFDIVEKVFKNSNRSFIYTLGICNDAQMEYEFAYKPQIRVGDMEMLSVAEQLASSRFSGKCLSDLSSADKCKMIKALYFNNKTSVPQLSRILGLSRELVANVLSY